MGALIRRRVGMRRLWIISVMKKKEGDEKKTEGRIGTKSSQTWGGEPIREK